LALNTEGELTVTLSALGESVPATGEPLLAELEWEPDITLDGAGTQGRLKGIAKAMPFAIALLGRSKPELIAVVEAMVEEGGRPALVALIKELDAGAAELDALLELANAARFRKPTIASSTAPGPPWCPRCHPTGPAPRAGLFVIGAFSKH
jgi:hypothetical protein